MPALSTRGGALSRIPRYPERLTLNAVTGICYFNHGGTGTAYRTNTREKYTFATGAVTAASNLKNICAFQSAAGNTTQAIIATGFNGQNTPAKEKFIFATETALDSQPFTDYNTYSASVGNANVAVTHLGWTVTYSIIKNTHNYATDATATTTSANMPGYAGCGFGTQQDAFLCVGGTSSGSSSLVDKYNYATKATASSTATPVGNSRGCSAGNAQQGVLSVGNTRETYIFTHSSTHWVASTLLPVKSVCGAAASSDTEVIIALGGTDTTNASNKKYKFNHATKAMMAATNSLVATWGGSAVSTSITGVNV